MKNWKSVYMVAVIGFAIGCLWACQGDSNAPTSPTGVDMSYSEPIAETSASTPTPTPTPAADPQPEGGSHCDLIDVEARRIVSKNDLDITIKVIATTDLVGDLYARLWYQNRGEKKLGDWPLESGVAEEITVTIPKYGEGRVTVDVEVDQDGDGEAEYQCDGSVTFNLKKKDPECPPNARIDFSFQKPQADTPESRTCPETEKVGFTVSHNMTRIETTVPKPECNPNAPTTEAGTCEFDKKKEDYTETGSVIGYMMVDGKELRCGDSSDTYTIEGCTDCDDYDEPTITGDIKKIVDKNTVTFKKGDVGPSPGSFNPPLPKTINRPNYGNPLGSFSTKYTHVYSPWPDLECRVNKTFTKNIPPKTCKYPNPGYNKKKFTASYNQRHGTNHNTEINAKVKVEGNGNWVLKLVWYKNGSSPLTALDGMGQMELDGELILGDPMNWHNGDVYGKDTKTINNCNRDGMLIIHYTSKHKDAHRGHGARWYLRLYRNGNHVKTWGPK